ncbi:MAG: hypothetical protein M0Z70_13665, partial [Nitrospiraceae bacterium]|nr:hypothetical protein [Nitrospiraceae bacterium]
SHLYRNSFHKWHLPIIFKRLFQSLFYWKYLSDHEDLLFIIDDIITTSRRPANISRDLTSQTDVFCIFRITEKRDLDYFYALNAELPDQIRALEPHHYIEYDHDSIEIRNPISLAG